MKLLKKMVTLILTLAFIATLLCSCGKETYTCGYCMQSVTQKPHYAKMLGQEIKLCDPCYEAIKDLQTEIK
ncbi:MAG: hypothetical protein Q4F21_11350 [Lachnospiraceae bacterium]|nr:hypothetical protein [Lachnospiraceae bacterium]